MYPDHKVVLVETRDPKNNYEVTGLSSVALPCKKEFITFLGNLLPEKAHATMRLHPFLCVNDCDASECMEHWVAFIL